jgi:hypothetical protein
MKDQWRKSEWEDATQSMELEDMEVDFKSLIEVHGE